MKSINYAREDIIRRAGDKLNLTHDEMKLILETTLDAIAEMLTEDFSRIRIELRNFGVFEVKPTKAKPRARNPRTNEEVYVPPRRKIHFKPGKMIRQELQREWIDTFE
jgi:nucleoid DNA-binding protein